MFQELICEKNIWVSWIFVVVLVYL